MGSAGAETVSKKTAYFTKKQKALMRKRRRKAKHAKPASSVDATAAAAAASPNNRDDSSRKHSIESNKNTKEFLVASDGSVGSNNTNNNNNNNNNATFLLKTGPGGVVQVCQPSNLAGKDARLFRKKARRYIKAQSVANNNSSSSSSSSSQQPNIEFLDERTYHRSHNGSNSSKRQFPSIKQLRLQKQRQQQQERIRQQRLEAEQKREQRVPEHVKAMYRAVDCEMVGIGTDGKISALARVSIVDWHGNVVLDTYVRVPTRVTDFRTHVSGITPALIKTTNPKAMDERKCRELVASLLKDRILVGHALKNDLHALMLKHPKHMIRDTAKYQPFQRFANGKWRPRKLRDIVRENLPNMQDFQEGSHDSVDDARATMEVFKIVQEQWEKSLQADAKQKRK